MRRRDIRKSARGALILIRLTQERVEHHSHVAVLQQDVATAALSAESCHITRLHRNIVDGVVKLMNICDRGKDPDSSNILTGVTKREFDIQNHSRTQNPSEATINTLNLVYSGSSLAATKPEKGHWL